ncbi:MAG: hypothetical protein ACFE89_12465 [Candidatus Hodarchaeota archaeon]
MVLVIRITNEGYRLIEHPEWVKVLQELTERWDHLFEEARWGSIEQAKEMYDQLFLWLDQFGETVHRYPYRAHIVLPPRDIELDELRYLLGSQRR